MFSYFMSGVLLMFSCIILVDNDTKSSFCYYFLNVVQRQVSDSIVMKHSLYNHDSGFLEPYVFIN